MNHLEAEQRESKDLTPTIEHVSGALALIDPDDGKHIANARGPVSVEYKGAGAVIYVGLYVGTSDLDTVAVEDIQAHVEAKELESRREDDQ